MWYLKYFVVILLWIKLWREVFGWKVQWFSQIIDSFTDHSPLNHNMITIIISIKMNSLIMTYEHHSSFFSLEDSPILFSLISFHFLSFFCFVDHNFNAILILLIEISFFQFFEHVMRSQMIEMPLMKLKDVSNTVQSARRPQKICILG